MLIICFFENAVFFKAVSLRKFYAMRILLFLVAILSFHFVSAQTISGYVYDEDENKPLEGAFVYLDGTTLSVSTDEQGFFKIVTPQKYNAALVISYIGFESIRLDDAYKYDKPFKVMLRTDAIALQEVVITKGGPFTRKQMMRAFKAQFLGKSKAGSSCKLENEDDVILYYDEAKNTLNARAYKTLKITNPRLKYVLNFDLSGFSVEYNSISLEDYNIRRSYFEGTTFFTDISKKGEADKRRKDAYLGSATHFMKTMAANDWQEQKFQLYADGWADNPDKYFKITDSLNYKKVSLIDIPPGLKKVRAELAAGKLNVLKKKGEQTAGKNSDVRFAILYDKKLQSGITMNNGYFYIDPNGLFFPIGEIMFAGYLGELKAGDMLPADYKYVP